MKNINTQTRDKKVDIIDEGFKKFVALKNYNRKLKVLIQLVVDGSLNGEYLPLINNNNDFDALVASRVLNFLKEFGFDGIHFHNAPYVKEAVPKYLNLMKAFSQAFKPGGYLLGARGDRRQWTIDLFDSGEFFTL